MLCHVFSWGLDTDNPPRWRLLSMKGFWIPLIEKAFIPIHSPFHFKRLRFGYIGHLHAKLNRKFSWYCCSFLPLPQINFNSYPRHESLFIFQQHVTIVSKWGLACKMLNMVTAKRKFLSKNCWMPAICILRTLGIGNSSGPLNSLTPEGDMSSS